MSSHCLPRGALASAPLISALLISLGAAAQPASAQPAPAQPARPADPQAADVQPADVQPAQPAPTPPAPGEPPAETGIVPGAAAPQPETHGGAVAAEASPDALRALEARIAEQERELAAQRRAIDELRATQDAVTMDSAAAEAKEAVLRLYGFTEVGVQRHWVRDDSVVSSIFASNALNFVVGQLNLYFDAQPHPDWRTLLEVRFTNAPHGEIASYRSLGVERVSTEQFDPHAATLNAPMWGGYTVIERAWSEYRFSDALYVQAGQFFTPFGIWNVDHGSPTLIALLLPQHIVQKIIPIRQVGVQLHGSFFTGPWELGYAAYVSNGRQELSNFDYDDDKGVGGRLIAAYSGDLVKATLGASAYAGDVEDRQIEILSLDPLDIDASSTFHYREWVTGADVSLDVGQTRLRLEGLIGRVKYDEAKRQPVPNTADLFYPDHYRQSVYGVLAHRLPWAGLEPFFAASWTRTPSIIGNTIHAWGGGLNIHVNESVKIKTEVGRGLFEDELEGQQDASVNNITNWATRLVVAF